MKRCQEILLRHHHHVSLSYKGPRDTALRTAIRDFVKVKRSETSQLETHPSSKQEIALKCCGIAKVGGLGKVGPASRALKNVKKCLKTWSFCCQSSKRKQVVLGPPLKKRRVAVRARLFKKVKYGLRKSLMFESVNVQISWQCTAAGAMVCWMLDVQSHGVHGYFA